MSIFKGFNRSVEDDDDEPRLNNSAMLEMSSAWSVWSGIANTAALKTLAANTRLSAEPHYPAGKWAVIAPNGVIYANPLHYAPASEWTFVLAHLLAHLGLRHQPMPSDTDDLELVAACEMAANALVMQLGIGSAPDGFLLPRDEAEMLTDVEALKAELHYLPMQWISGAGHNVSDLIASPAGTKDIPTDDWGMMLTQGLLVHLGGKGGLAPWATVGMSKPRQALQWFVDNFPLLSALASHFNIIEDRDTIAAYNIQIAAVIAERMEILVNPDVDLTPNELRFIMGHELMHVGLLHHVRREERDHYIWNIACDFVINAWLIEMGLGEMPPRGGLYDAQYTGMSANEIYDKLINDPQYTKSLVTFRGQGVGDILPPGSLGKPRQIGGRQVSEMAEELMKEGVNAHLAAGRGLLPAGLLEMVTPAYAPPPNWKISLTRWFDSHFDPVAPARSYFRQSRRQQATPDIPRPRYAVPQFPEGSGMFGVMLDTSGSMENELLSKCLGAIAALAQKHRIKQVRLVFCDAQPHDEGYVPVKRLTEPMHIKGRGGTRLQPGIDVFEHAKDFPKDAPLLVITDGACDELTINLDHAFLIPEGNSLPFNPVGPVFLLA